MTQLLVAFFLALGCCILCLILGYRAIHFERVTPGVAGRELHVGKNDHETAAHAWREVIARRELKI